MIYYNRFVVSTVLHDMLLLPSEIIDIIVELVYHPYRTKGGVSYFLYLS